MRPNFQCLCCFHKLQRQNPFIKYYLLTSIWYKHMTVTFQMLHLAAYWKLKVRTYNCVHDAFQIGNTPASTFYAILEQYFWKQIFLLATNNCQSHSVFNMILTSSLYLSWVTTVFPKSMDPYTTDCSCSLSRMPAITQGQRSESVKLTCTIMLLQLIIFDVELLATDAWVVVVYLE